MRIPYISMLAAGVLALGGCAYGDYGYGSGGYYGGYGYGPSVSVGYSSGYGPYYGGYGYGGYGGGYGGYGYGYDPFGWYGDYYYPGTGVYVYDTNHNAHVWNNSQQSYWTSRRQQYQSHTGRNWSRSDWNGFSHRTTTNTTNTTNTTPRRDRWGNRTPG